MRKEVRMNEHLELWSKDDGVGTPYPLLAHLLDSATVAEVLFDLWLRDGLRDLLQQELGEHARRIVQFVVGSHDIGKASPIFQMQYRRDDDHWRRIREVIDGSGFYGQIPVGSPLRDFDNKFARRHEQWSAYCVAGGFLSSSDEARDRWHALAALGHHGYFSLGEHNRIFAAKRKTASKELEEYGWLQAQRDLVACVAAACDVDVSEMPDEVSPAVTLLLSGLTILADRIASGVPFVEAGGQILTRTPDALKNPAQWIVQRRKDAAKRVRDTVGIYSSWGSEEEAQRSILGEHDPRPIQEEALSVGDGLWSLMAQTGGGKTEAALLRHSTRNERLIFLLPTQATSNAIMRRVQRAYSTTSNVAALAHELASVEDFYVNPVSVDTHEDSTSSQPSGLYPSSFVKSGAARLLAPVAVGTVDQALMASLPAKWIHLRLLALANAHVVIDEVHTLDQYQTKLLEGILPWLSATRTRVTFLTATMPSWQREALMTAYRSRDLQLSDTHFPASETLNEAGLNTVPMSAASRTIRVELADEPYERLVDSHVSWCRQQCLDFPRSRIGIVCNTVARAQELGRKLEADGRTLVLHSRMTAEHRRRVASALEDTLGPNGRGDQIVLIGTQAIEASLDIDLDLLRTELCPPASVIQRAGRQWRRSDPERSQRVPKMVCQSLSVVAISSAQPWQCLPYLPAELRRTREWLMSHEKIQMPADAQAFVDVATISFDDAVDSNDIEELAVWATRARAGIDRRARLSDALLPDAYVEDFSQLTQDLTVEERQTRFLDGSETFRVILGGDPDRIPGAFEGDAKDLLAVRAFDQDALRVALRASLPLSGRQFEALFKRGPVSLGEAHSLLRSYYFVPDAEDLYDPLVGFVDED